MVDAVNGGSLGADADAARANHADGRADARAATTARAPLTVGVFDSGLGGLSVLREIRAVLPGARLVYFADSGNAPYGGRSDAFVRERSQAIARWLIGRGAQAIVVACNTATAAAIDGLRDVHGLPIVGVEPGLKPAAAHTRSGTVGVLATRGTLASARYAALRDRVARANPKVCFVEAAGEGWVELVEAGAAQSPEAFERVREVVRPLLDAGADTLVLGCTHYPFLADAVRAAANGARIIETGHAIARQLLRRVDTELGLMHANGAATIEFSSSGDAAHGLAVARRLLGDVGLVAADAA
ncbi:glutamate racemase [Derxia gummosa]|uniref:Glutamate racemase n=1 Tax=Derxia gummosa DSM 723 TaxID=1121388 RepID=A0A8B6XBK0_9BURK|nr:glutamate racemase [Derxia gummosa]